MAEELPELLVRDRNSWRRWLAAHHQQASGVRLVLARAGKAGATRLSYAQALEEALCYGWIDGQGSRRDEVSWRVRFTPRRRRSQWSKRNLANAERLIAEGRMQPAGTAEIERAKADGRWRRAYSGPATAVVPPDLQLALGKNRKAAKTFRQLNSQNRYAVLYRVQALKTKEARARKIDQLVSMLARGETIYPQRRPTGRKSASRP
jgi:uncharacterized protein YdeI (YjbR/CyaY-like superfamily)